MRWILPMALSLLAGACVDLSRDVVLAPDAARVEVDLGFDATPPPVDAELGSADARASRDVGAVTDARALADAGLSDAAADALGPDASPPDAGPDAARDALPDAEPDALPDAEPDLGPPCEPSPEVCNALDDDCDGVVDEALPWVGNDCNEVIGQCRVRGFERCDRAGERVCAPEEAPSFEGRSAAIRGCGCNVDAEAPERPYLVCTNGVTWTEAAQVCALIGGQLVVLETLNEVAEVSRLLRRHGGRWWVGLSDQAEEGRFVWLDGRPVDPAVTPWGEGEPNDYPPAGGEDCVELDSVRRELNDSTCGDQQSFVCEPVAVP